MAGHAGLLRDLADLVTPMAGDRLFTCHRDCTPATCWSRPLASWPCSTGTTQGSPPGP